MSRGSGRVHGMANQRRQDEIREAWEHNHDPAVIAAAHSRALEYAQAHRAEFEQAGLVAASAPTEEPTARTTENRSTESGDSRHTED
jgi:hypothetical protein